MSGEMALWAVRQDIKDPIAKLVLVALCEHCNEVGECYPNHGTLTDYVRRSKPYIREKIRLLEAEGWLKRMPRYGQNKRQTSNLYIINEDRGETRKAYHERKKREAEEKASKYAKTKSSGDCRASPTSSVMPDNQGDVMAGNQALSVMAGNHPESVNEEIRGASAPAVKIQREEKKPCPIEEPSPERRQAVGELMKGLSSALNAKRVYREPRRV
jgi:hypothetical protein